MPAPASNATLDGLSIVREGMHSGINPRLLPKDQVAMAVNCTFRNGLPRTRPVWVKQTLHFPDETTQERASGLFQTASFYQGYGNNNSCLVAMIGGRLFRYDVGGGVVEVQEITPTGDQNDPTKETAWMWQAEDWLIVQNGQANPWFFDGSGVRRSAGEAGNELPPGCMGCYVQGRVWQVLPSAQQEPSQAYIAGDLVYSHGETGPWGGREAVLQTTELSLVPGGRPFSVPVSAGNITGMGSTAVMDTSLGQGSLLVHTLGSVFSVNVPFDREQWFTSGSPLVVVSLPNYGTMSHDAIASVNGDQWYRSLDGIRSYQIGRRDQGTWVSTPLSVEMDQVINLDTPQWMNRASGVLFNNRYLVTCAPFVTEGRGTTYRGVIALDFNNVSTLTTRSQPCYDGLWTGVFVKKLVKGFFNGRERCFAWGLACDGGLELWELLEDDHGYFDWDGSADVGVECFFETRSMGWGDNGNVLKRFQTVDLYLDRLAGNDEVSFEFKYRSDQDPIWNDWKTFELCAPIKSCPSGEGCQVPVQVREQYRTYLRLSDPADTPCKPNTGRSPRTGYEFQVLAWWKGFVQWNRMHCWATVLSDSVYNACLPGPSACQVVEGCDEPWFNYTVNGCGNVPPLPPTPGPTGDVPSIITEQGEPITVEDNTDKGIRTEDQLPVPGPTPTPQPPIPVGPPQPHVPPNVTKPTWPPPDPYPCPGQGYDLSPLQITDDTVSPPVAGYVGVPNVADPNQWMLDNTPDGQGADAIQRWANAVWLQFLSEGTPYSNARVVWYNLPTSGDGFMASAAFTSPQGILNTVTDLDWKLVVETCP